MSITILPKKYLLLTLVLVIAAFFRFYLISEIPPGLYPDEAMNGNNALEAIQNTGLFGENGPSFGFKAFYPENNGREGLFINIQAISLLIFGNKPWTLRVVSAVFGVLTVLGLYLLTRELFRDKNPKSGETIAILSSFFLAVSYWHINFSRTGFRAITVPFFATFALYFLLKGLRRGNIPDLSWAGIFTGLGFYTYIAFRFMPFVLLVPIGWYLWQWRKNRDANMRMHENYTNKNCAPCSIALFLFVTFVIALPLAIYFVQNPQDFLGRSGQVSIFTGESPLKEFIKSNLLTAGMLFFKGDCNWRHNLACKPELHWSVALFFAIGLIIIIKTVLNYKSEILNSKQIPNPNYPNPKRTWLWSFGFGNLFSASDLEFRISSHTGFLLLAWFGMMSLPATLTKEGLPHALRSIGMIPPIMIIAGIGAFSSINYLISWFDRQKVKWPNYVGQLERVKKETILLFLLTLILITISTYRDYFIKWGDRPETYSAFSSDLLNIGKFLNSLPGETKKYVLVNYPGAIVRNVPMPAQPIMFATNTFHAAGKFQKNIFYFNDTEQLKSVNMGENAVITTLNPLDKTAISEILQRFPQLKIKVPGDFVIFQAD